MSMSGWIPKVVFSLASLEREKVATTQLIVKQNQVNAVVWGPQENIV